MTDPPVPWEADERSNGGVVRHGAGEVRVHGFHAVDGTVGEVTIGLSALDLAGRQVEHASLSMSPDMAARLRRLLDAAIAAT
jgi:hypothetical protein